MEFLSYDPNFTDNMEEDTDDESYEEEEDEYVINHIWVCLFFLKFYYDGVSHWLVILYVILARVPTSTQMMKM